MDNNFIFPPGSYDSGLFRIICAGKTYQRLNATVEKNKNSSFVFEYCLSGKGKLCVGNDTYEICPGDLFVLPAGAVGKYTAQSSEDWLKIWFSMTGRMAEQLFLLYSLMDTYVYNGVFYMEQIFVRMIDVLSDKTKTPEEINSEATLILTEIVLKLHKENRGTESISEDAKRLKQYIDYHSEDNISVDRLAGLIFRSKSQTIRIFKKNFGLTPYEYLLKNKISRAKLLLEVSDASIKEISYRIGFSDEHYFSNIFKSKTGFSPSEYRKNKKQGAVALR